MTGVSEAQTAADALTALISRLRELEEKATPGEWRVGRQEGAPRDHIVDMGAPPSSPYFRMNKGMAASQCSNGVPAFGIVESDDAEADEIAANAALIVEMRNGLPLLLEAASGKSGEADYQAWFASQPVDPEDVTPEALAVCAHMLEEYGSECFPANEQGQVHFARSMMSATATCIRGFLANQEKGA